MYHIKNKVQLIGTVVETPIVADTQDNGKHARLSMRTTEKLNTETETIEHNLFGTGKVAYLIEKHVQKGSEIAIQGKLTHRSYTDNDGIKRYVTEVEIREILLLEKKG